MRFSSEKQILNSLFFLAPMGLILLWGCVPPPPPGPEWYTGESMPVLDHSVLAGKVIMIDPGHGGIFKGAVGRGGMKEKDINLLVSLRLLILLDSLGAQPILTRVTDMDFLSDASRPLREDLAERMKRARLSNPDLFVSVHHNSGYDSTYNATKTFYAMTDNGPSFQAAVFLHRRFVRSLKIDIEELIPGNYFVLRNSTLPALLGEPSYLSNKKQEAILVSDSAVDVEARAYLLGIYDYFAAGIPHLEEILPDGKVFDYPDPLVYARIHPGRYGIDPSGITCRIDSQELSAHFVASDRVCFRPVAPLANKWHDIHLEARSRNGMYAVSRSARFRVDLAPERLSVGCTPAFLPSAPGSPVRVAVRVEDRLGRPVSDGIPVHFSASSGKWKRERTRTVGGMAYGYLRSAGKEKAAVRVQCRDLVHDLELSRATEVCVTGFLRNAANDSAVGNALILTRTNVPVERSDPEGFFCLRRPGREMLVHKRGFSPSPLEGQASNITVAPIDNGCLFGKRILIDPEYGGEESGPRTPDGLRAADMNLAFAEKLEEFLDLAGAEVTLTRNGNITRTPYQRVQQSIDMRAEVVVSIGYDSLPPHGLRLHHYPKSKSGKDICRNVAAAFKQILGRAHYGGRSAGMNTILQQTPCPAVLVIPGSILAPDSSWVHRVYSAYAVYRGLAGHFDESSTRRTIWFTPPDTVPKHPETIVRLDRWLALPLLPSEKVVWHGIPPGRHFVEVLRGNAEQWEHWIKIGRAGSWHPVP